MYKYTVRRFKIPPKHSPKCKWSNLTLSTWQVTFSHEGTLMALLMTATLSSDCCGISIPLCTNGDRICGQSSWLQIRRSWVQFSALPEHPLSAKVGTNSPTSSGHSIGIVHSWTKAMKFVLLCTNGRSYCLHHKACWKRNGVVRFITFDALSIDCQL
jgi:hypothetical protein